MGLIKASSLKKTTSFEDTWNHLNSIIELANEQGNKSTRTYGLKGEFGDSSLYNGETPFTKDILTALRINGFRASIKYDEKQFVDIYLYIEWD